ncbi:MAG: glycosyltransferase family 39 protein, partial [Solirubrobacteraceae bacterium]
MSEAATLPAAGHTLARRRTLSSAQDWWPLAAIVLLAAILRLTTLGEQSFWYDEAFTPVHVLRAGLGATLHNVVHTENTPPLWYVLEWGVSRVLGTGAVALRLLSALAGIATVLVAWAIGRELASRRAAIVCATLVAVNPLFVWYSQEARAYGLFVLCASLALLCFVRALREPTTRRLVEFALSASLALLTHYFAVFLLIPMILWLVWRAVAPAPQVDGSSRERANSSKNVSRVLCAVALPVLVGAALIPLVLAQGGHGTQWIGEWALGSRLEAIPQYYLTGYTGSALGHGIELLVFVVVLAGFVWGLWCTLTPREERGALIALVVTACGVLIPIVLAFAGADYLAPRNLVAAMVPLSALIA